MTPTKLLKLGAGLIAAGLLLLFVAPDNSPEPTPEPTEAPVAEPTAEETPEPTAAEATLATVPEPTVDPILLGRQQRFRDELVAAAAADLPTPKLRTALKELSAAGGDAVSILVEACEAPAQGGGTPLSRTRVLYALLVEDGSPAAREALLQAALAPPAEPATLGPLAAQAFASISPSTTETAALLKSTEPAVQMAAMQAMAGQALTGPAVQALIPLLRAPTSLERDAAAKAFALDTSADQAAGKARALVDAAGALMGVQDSTAVDPFTGLTGAQMSKAAFASALASMPGGITAARTLLPNPIALLAVGGSGDESTRSALHGLIRRSAGYDRLLAVDALASFATEEDAGLLLELKSDPYQFKAPHGADDAAFPVRIRATEILLAFN